MLLLGIFLITATAAAFRFDWKVNTVLGQQLGLPWRTPNWLHFLRLFMMLFAFPIGIWLVVTSVTS